MPWMRAFPERVALFCFSTELGEVNICLKVYFGINNEGNYALPVKPLPYLDHDGAAKKTFPRVFSIIGVILVQQCGPLIARDYVFATTKIFFNPRGM